MPDFLARRGSIWRFVRRVPAKFAAFDRCGVIRHSARVRIADDRVGRRAAAYRRKAERGFGTALEVAGRERRVIRALARLNPDRRHKVRPAPPSREWMYAETHDLFIETMRLFDGAKAYTREENEWRRDDGWARHRFNEWANSRAYCVSNPGWRTPTP